MAEMRQKGRGAGATAYRTAGELLRTESKAYSAGKTYDIFLSHCFKDAEVVLGVAVSLREMGYQVYIDWLEDSHLNRDNVSKETAEILRNRMKVSKSLFFASSEQSGNLCRLGCRYSEVG
jgi:hypothetical protein